MPCGITQRLNNIVKFAESLKRCHENLSKRIKSKKASEIVKDDYTMLITWMKKIQNDGPDDLEIPDDIHEMAEKYSWEHSPAFSLIINDIMKSVDGNGVLKPYVWAAIIEGLHEAKISIPQYEPHPVLDNATIAKIPEDYESTEDGTNYELMEDIETDKADTLIENLKPLDVEDESIVEDKDMEIAVEVAETEVIPKVASKSKMEKKRKCLRNTNRHITLNEKVDTEMVGASTLETEKKKEKEETKLKVVEKKEAGKKKEKESKKKKGENNCTDEKPSVSIENPFSWQSMFFPFPVVPGMKMEGLQFKVFIESMTFNNVTTSEFKTSTNSTTSTSKLSKKKKKNKKHIKGKKE